MHDSLDDDFSKLSLKQPAKCTEHTPHVYARKVELDWMPGDYEQPLEISFEPDTFQKQAFHLISRDHSVFVTAHTSSGKTLVAEYAIALAQSRHQKTVYTSPIKALSNQKYYEFRHKFDDVGILTGDVQINTSGSCTIMTTEILRNMLYRNVLDQNVKYVIFDEVHYINDRERGVVWEECIIMLPAHITLVLLSATVPNSMEFAQWIGRTRNRTVYVIATDKRSVPLEHYIYADDKIYTLDGEVKPEMCPESIRKKHRIKKTSEEFANYFNRKKTAQRLSIVKLAELVIERCLVPSIFFCFSRHKCEMFANHLLSIDLTTPEEKSSVLVFLAESLACLGQANSRLPQVKLVSDLVVRGVGIHFSSLLPILKEIVEMLLSRNLIKILIATETFAMGINMPAKSCVFLTVTKIDADSFRYITPGEYMQMSGRAGRRGKDHKGVSILAPTEPLKPSVVRDLTSGAMTPLRSQFRLSFNILLSALRLHLRVEDIIRKSFGEDKVQKNLGFFTQRLETVNDALRSIKTVSCAKCSDLPKYVDSVREICMHNCTLMRSSNIVQKNTPLLLKSNDIVTVREVRDEKIFVCGSADNVLSKRYLNHVHTTQRNGHHEKEVVLDDVFVVLSSGEPFFEYKLTEINSVVLSNKIKQAHRSLPTFDCTQCEHFGEHYELFVAKQRMRDEVAEINKNFSDESLGIIGDYYNRLDFLMQNGYVDENKDVCVKGKVAAEVRTVPEILITELIVDNKLGDLSGNEILSTLSAMIFKESVEIELGEGLTKVKSMLEAYHRDINHKLIAQGIEAMRSLSFCIMPHVHGWLEGKPLGEIARMGVQEGTFVKLLLRLDEACREMIGACEAIGNECLLKKVEQARELLKREDIVVKSLYL